MKRNPAVLSAKIASLVKGGPGRVHIVCDFDRTLTHPDSETSWSALKKCSSLSLRFHEGTSELYKRFHPIEIDATIPMEHRIEAMEQWWQEAHQLLLEENVTRETFRTLIAREEANRSLYFRDGAHELMEECASMGIPVLIFSAGLGDLIDAAIEPLGHWQSVHVISNHLLYDGATGKATGFRHKKNIHTFSKKEVALIDLNEPWGNTVRDRPNVILLGDSLGDADMAAGVPHDLVLRIGFLNEENVAAREQHLDTFDIVLEKDNTLQYVRDVLQQIRGDNIKQ